MKGQLPLQFQLRPTATFANYLIGDNLEAVGAVDAMAQGGGESYLYLWGREGTGKTHLAQAACSRVHACGKPVAYIPLAQYRELAPEILEDLEQMALVCLDDLPRVIGLEPWELALFSLFNRLRERGGRLLVTADQPQRQLQPVLADLASRLSWGPGYQLHPLRDDELLEGLTRLAAERGLVLQSEIGRYLLNRCPRDMKYLQTLLDELDRASLVAQRRLTIPFVKEVLQGVWGEPGPAPGTIIEPGDRG